MFVLTMRDCNFRHHLCDISTLRDVVLGLTDDEATAERITNIAGNMLIGDVFHNHDIYLKCKEEENDR